MALAQCRECGREVSTEATSCPHCGVPRPTATTAQSAGGAQAKEDSPFRKPAPSSSAQQSPSEKPQPAESPSQRGPYCGHCGAGIHEHAVACTRCGGAPTAGRKFCRICGAAVSNPDAIICLRCGSSIARNRGGIGSGRSRAVQAMSTGEAILWALLCFPLGYVKLGQGLKWLVWLVIVFCTFGLAWVAMAVDFFMCNAKAQATGVLGEWEWFPRV